MANMKSDTLLGYAVFQLSPKRSRCELFVSSDGRTEKLASGLLKPFISHLQIVEEQVASASQSIKLDVGRCRNAETWFTKGTLERFVRFVSTPEVLELVNTLDAEMSQLEAARRIYSQGAGDQLSGGSGLTAGDDATKKELLKAIDVRIVAVLKDLSNACARAAAAGFNIDTVSQLQMFADKFGAHRLKEACTKFISLDERRPKVTQPWGSGLDDQAIRSSYGSDMSIDNDPPSPSQATTCQQPDPPASAFPKLPAFSRESSVEREEGNGPSNAVLENDSKDESSTSGLTGSVQACQPARRLSVQDRINMFENKQKENSGGKPVVVKPVELRRMSSNLSASGAATEKAVLRRWSGASDMSIDLSADKKDAEIPICPPVSTVISQEKQVSNLNYGDNTLKGASFNNSEQSNKSNSNLGSRESDVLKDQVGWLTQPRSFIRTEDQESSADSINTSSSGKIEGLVGFGNQGKLKGYPSGEDTQMTGVKNQVSFETHIKPSVSKGNEQLETGNRREGSESGPEGGAGSRIQKALASRYKGVEGDFSSAQKEARSVGETDIAEKKESRMPGKVSGTSVSTFEESGTQRLKFNKQGLTLEPSKKVQVQRHQISSGENSMAQISGPVEAHEGFDSFSTPPPEQAQRVRQSKGNQELNNDLKTKADELEKLFAEHKLRVPGEQSNSSLKGKLGDTQPVADISPDNHTKAVHSQYDGDDANRKFSDLSVSEGSRGKFYHRYMQLRDAMLREDWSANRELKEARLKFLQDSLERNRSEMKAKISGSIVRRRAERLRSYNSRSIMKREQLHLDFGDSEDDKEALDFPEQSRLHENKALDDSSSRGGVSRGAQEKKHLANNRNLSSTPRTSVAPVATKNSTIGSGKRRMLPENPLAQSVPNFSDMRKENTKPSSGANKATRSQGRSFARSKSISDESAIVKDDKSRRSQSLRKSSENPSDFTEMSPVESDGACLAPDEGILKKAVTKPFLKKGSRTNFVSQTINAREKVSEHINNVEENYNMESGPDEFVSMGKDDDEEEFESLNNEDQNVLGYEEPKQKFVNSGSENGDGALMFSLVDQALGSKLPAEPMPDWSGESPVLWNSHTQHPFAYPHEISDVDASVDSPVGSPASWNSHSLNQMETDSARMRKKWGAAQKPMLVAHSSNNQSRKDMTRGFKRLLKFGRKSRGSESLVDWISATTSEGDDDTEDGANRLSDDLRKSRMGFSLGQASEDSFNESQYFNEAVESSSQNSIPANFKLRQDHNSTKAPRSSFFSLPTFRNKASDSKLR